MKGYLTIDHVSDAIGLDPAITISKNGAAFGNPSAGSSVLTEIGSGWYYFDLTTTDTGTLGPLIIRATHATMDTIEMVYQVVDPVTMGASGITTIDTVVDEILADTAVIPGKKIRL
jgi:hypothetical protein